MDVDSEVKEMEENLNSEDLPWTCFIEHYTKLTERLSNLFSQFLQLFTYCKPLNAELLELFDQQQMKRFAEGFFFVESSCQKLLEPNNVNLNYRIFDLARKDGYLTRLPSMNMLVKGIDVESEYVTLVVEERYIPSGATEFSSAMPLAVHSETCLPLMVENHNNNCQFNSGSLRESMKSNKSKISSLSMEKLQSFTGFCFPGRTLEPEEVYERSAKFNHNLDIPDERFAKRRMTDPGEIANGFEKVPLTENDENSNGRSVKSFSTTTISVSFIFLECKSNENV